MYEVKRTKIALKYHKVEMTRIQQIQETSGLSNTHDIQQIEIRPKSFQCTKLKEKKLRLKITKLK